MNCGYDVRSQVLTASSDSSRPDPDHGPPTVQGSASKARYARPMPPPEGFLKRPPSFERVCRIQASDPPLTIWRPVPPHGFSAVGDIALRGDEEPAAGECGIMVRDSSDGSVKRPTGYQERGRIEGSRGMAAVSFWYPVAPPGYSALGALACKGLLPPSTELVHCIRNDLLVDVGYGDRCLGSSHGGHGHPGVTIWEVANSAKTFLTRLSVDRSKHPPSRLAFGFEELDKVHSETVSKISVSVKKASFCIFDDFGGLITPLWILSAKNLKILLHGEEESFTSSSGFSVSVDSYNGFEDTWEPLIEECAGFLRHQQSINLEAVPLSQLSLLISTPLNLNVSTTNVNHMLEAYASWMRLGDLEEAAQREYYRTICDRGKEASSSRSLIRSMSNLDKNKTTYIVAHNNLGMNVFVRVSNPNGSPKVFPFSSGAMASITIPPRMALTDSSERVKPPHLRGRRLLALRILQAQAMDRPANSQEEFHCRVKLRTSPSSAHQAMAHDMDCVQNQTARTHSCSPYSPAASNSRCTLLWDEVFLLETSERAEETVEVQIVSTSTGLVSAACSWRLRDKIPRMHRNAQLKARPARLAIDWTRVEVQTVPIWKAVDDQSGVESEESIKFGDLSVSHFLIQGGAPDRNEFKPAMEQEVNPGTIEVGPSDSGPWAKVGTVYVGGAVAWDAFEHLVASEISVVHGVKHLVLRSLSMVSNQTDMALELSLVPVVPQYLEDQSALENERSKRLPALDIGESSRNIEVEQVFENQRFHPILGWGSSWPSHLLPTDPKRWSYDGSAKSTQEFKEVALSEGWIWKGDWKVDKTGHVDRDGWAYASQFKHLKWPPQSFKYRLPRFHTVARRRRWIRIREYSEEAPNYSRRLLGVIQPGKSTSLPSPLFAPDSPDGYLQLRPVKCDSDSQEDTDAINSEYQATVQGCHGWAATHDWSQLCQSKRSHESPFRVKARSEAAEVMKCDSSQAIGGPLSSDSIWLHVESTARSIGSDRGLDSVQDWTITVRPTMTLENQLPMAGEFVLWEKSKSNSRLQRGCGALNPGSKIGVSAVDPSKVVSLSWKPAGNWRPLVDLQDSVVIHHPYKDRASTMEFTNGARRLVIHLHYEIGPSQGYPLAVALSVPMWIDFNGCPPVHVRILESLPSSAPPEEGHREVSRMKSLQSAGAQLLSKMAFREKAVVESIPFGECGLNQMLAVFGLPKGSTGLSLSLALVDGPGDGSQFGPSLSLSSIESQEKNCIISAAGEGSQVFLLSATMEVSPMAKKSKVIVLRPLLTLTNRLGRPIHVCNAKDPATSMAVSTLAEKDWAVSSLVDEALLVQVKMEETSWSYPFRVARGAAGCITLRNRDSNVPLNLSLEVHERGSDCSLDLTFRWWARPLPYRLENRTHSARLRFRQTGLDDSHWIPLNPNSSAAFSWEDTMGFKALDIRQEGESLDSFHTIDIETVNHFNKQETRAPVTPRFLGSFSITILRNGVQKILVLRDTPRSPWAAIPGNLTEEGSSRGGLHRSRDGGLCYRPLGCKALVFGEFGMEEMAAEAVRTAAKYTISIANFGLSVVDHRPQELIFVYLEELRASMVSSEREGIWKFKLMARKVQMDNQLPLSPMPVLLAPKPGQSTRGYVAKLSFSYDYSHINGAQHYPKFRIWLTDVSWKINIHEPIIWRLLDMYSALHLDKLSATTNHQVVTVDPEVVVDDLRISNVRLKITFEAAPELRPRGLLGIWSPLLTTVGNVSRTPIHLKGETGNLSCRQSEISPAVMRRIQRDLLYQAINLLSSFDVLAIYRSVFAALSKGTAELSRDKQFLILRSRSESSRRASSIGEGVFNGCQSFLQSIIWGVTGPIRQPLFEYQEEGWPGLAKGIGKGCISFLVLPISGLFDFLSKSIDGVDARVSIMEECIRNVMVVQPIRLPRAVGGNHVLLPFNEERARGQIILQLAKSKALLGDLQVFGKRSSHPSTETYHSHFHIRKRVTVILSTLRVLLLRRPRSPVVDRDWDLHKACQVIDDVSWHNILHVEILNTDEHKDAVAIHVRIVERRSHSPLWCYCASSIQSEDVMRALQEGILLFGTSERTVAKSWQPGGGAQGLGSALSSGRSSYRDNGEAYRQVQDRMGNRKILHRNSSFIPPLSPRDSLEKQVTLFEKIWGAESVASANLSCGNCQVDDIPLSTISIWRPVLPQGYISVGDVAHVGYEPPESTVVYRNIESHFSQPVGFRLVWRNCESESQARASIWMPIPAPGYVALGCVVVNEYVQPAAGLGVDTICCIKQELAVQGAIGPETVWHEPSSCVWPWPMRFCQVENAAKTFVVVKHVQVNAEVWREHI